MKLQIRLAAVMGVWVLLAVGPAAEKGPAPFPRATAAAVAPAERNPAGFAPVTAAAGKGPAPFSDARAASEKGAGPFSAHQRRGAAILVSVAASLTDVLRPLAEQFEQETGTRVQVNGGGSNALARQIVNGAPVDLFISADEAQMDVVENAARLAPATRTALLANQLVVVTAARGGVAVRSAHDLAAAPVRRLAMGTPYSVPAGVYGRQWLEKLGLWDAVQKKVVPLPTVRAALAAVREGRAQAAIVYATDARLATDVAVALVVPDTEAPRIVYPAAVISGTRQQAAAAFLSFLRRPDARRVFEAAGFRVLTP